MKKILSFLTILALSALVITGCSTTGSTPTVEDEAAAFNAGMAVNIALFYDNMIESLTGVSYVSAGTTASSVTLVRDADGWFHATASVSDEANLYSGDVYFKAYDENEAEIVTVGGLNESGVEISKLVSSGHITITIQATETVYTITTGQGKSKPLTIIHDAGFGSIDGPIELDFKDEGNTFTLTLDFDNIGLNASGLPTTGSVSWAIYSKGTEVAAGTITFNGTNTFTITVGERTFTFNRDTKELVEVL